MSLKEDLNEVISELDYAMNRIKFYNEDPKEHLTVDRLETLVNTLKYANLDIASEFNEGYSMGYRDGQKEQV
jgi:hypothetical protein